MPRLPGLPLMLTVWRREGLRSPPFADCLSPETGKQQGTSGMVEAHPQASLFCSSSSSSLPSRFMDGTWGSNDASQCEIQVHHHLSVFGFGLGFY